MTTHTLDNFVVRAADAHRRTATSGVVARGERLAAVVTAIAFVLLLPGAALLMSVLSA